MLVMRYDFSFGTYGTGNGQFHSPGGIGANSAGTAIYVVDDLLNNCQQFDAAGNWVRTFGGPVSGFSGLSDPFDVAVHPVNGDVYVSDGPGSHRIAQFQADGTYIRTWGTFGSGNGQFLALYHIYVSRAGIVYALDQDRHDVQSFTASGAFISVWLVFEDGGSVGFDVSAFDDSVWVYSPPDNSTTQYTPAHTVLSSFPGPTSTRLYVGDTSGYDLFILGVPPDYADPNTFSVLTQNGAIVTTFGSTGSGAGQFLNALDSVVRGNKIWIADQNNFRIQQWTLVDVVPTSGPHPAYGRGAC